MKSLIKSSITFFYSSLLRRNVENQSLRVLMYHSISPSKHQGDLWSVDLEYFSQHMEHINATKDLTIHSSKELFFGIPDDGIVITFDDGYSDNFDYAAPILFDLNIPFSIFVVSDYIKDAKKNYMNPSQLRELSKNPLVSIGSHSKTHIPLTDCSKEELKNEISGSKADLEDLLGKEVSMFSYPHGKFNTQIKEMVAKDYKLAYTSHYDVNEPSQDKLALNRNEIWGSDNLLNFKGKLNGDWDWMKYRSL